MAIGGRSTIRRGGATGAGRTGAGGGVGAATGGGATGGMATGGGGVTGIASGIAGIMSGPAITGGAGGATGCGCIRGGNRFTFLGREGRDRLMPRVVLGKN